MISPMRSGGSSHSAQASALLSTRSTPGAARRTWRTAPGPPPQQTLGSPSTGGGSSEWPVRRAHEMHDAIPPPITAMAGQTHAPTHLRGEAQLRRVMQVHGGEGAERAVVHDVGVGDG
eukprot:COSAG01_NODE_32079_length_586_cov_7.108830_1_plen_117_part_10